MRNILNADDRLVEYPRYFKRQIMGRIRNERIALGCLFGFCLEAAPEIIQGVSVRGRLQLISIDRGGEKYI
jgi:hypothetical protein